MQKALNEVSRLRLQLDERTKEFNYLSNRLKELESGGEGKGKEAEKLQVLHHHNQHHNNHDHHKHHYY
jgi:hypothetical protein